MKYFFALILFLKVLLLNAQVSDEKPVITDVVNRISEDPQSIPFTNSYPIINEGGHIQGVQLDYLESGHYVFMTGSSSLYSYLAILDIDEGSVNNIYPLFQKPLKHAGGFQIAENILAVGIEDNDLRNYSEICFYDISHPKEFNPNPVFSIERKGDFERATAGCVALARLKEHWLVISGDWNTRHMDFYVSHDLELVHGFELVQEMTMAEQNKAEWIDTSWLPYQNINLWSTDSTLYLLGMTSLDDVNIVDVFILQQSDLADFHLIKIARKALKNLGGKFIWGGGVHLANGKVESLIASPRNIRESNQLFLYPVEK